MPCIVAELEFDRPLARSEIHHLLQSGEWCMGQYGVKPRRHYVADDGKRVTCVFDAPDAEALRTVERTAGITPARHIWPATIHLGRGTDADAAPRRTDPSRCFAIVERSFGDPAILDDLQAMEEAKQWCLDLRRVSFVRSYFSVDRRRMLCIYEAPDAEAVRDANLQTGLPFDRVWPMAVIGQEAM